MIRTYAYVPVLGLRTEAPFALPAKAARIIQFSDDGRTRMRNGVELPSEGMLRSVCKQWKAASRDEAATRAAYDADPRWRRLPDELTARMGDVYEDGAAARALAESL